MTGPADRWIRRTTIGCVALLALIAGTVSYIHMHELVALHGQPGWVAALTPLSVDGMIVAASTTLLSESRSGGRGGVLPWALLVFGSVASLAANVAVAEPTLIGRVIAAWPSFALTASYELLTRQVRRGAFGGNRLDEDDRHDEKAQRQWRGDVARQAPLGRLTMVQSSPPPEAAVRGDASQRQAWQWALARHAEDGVLPAAGPLPVSTAGTSGGGGSSRMPA